MRVRDKIKFLNALDHCHGCKKIFSMKDHLYIDEDKLVGVHAPCIHLLPKTESFALAPLDHLHDLNGLLEKLRSKKT